MNYLLNIEAGKRNYLIITPAKNGRVSVTPFVLGWTDEPDFPDYQDCLAVDALTVGESYQGDGAQIIVRIA